MAKISDIRYDTPDQPRQVRLDTTTRCNASCLSCHRNNSTRSGEMPLDLVLQVLNDVSKWEQPLKEIVPVNYGEFLLHPQWEAIMALIETKLKDTYVVLPTNGMLLTLENIEKLSEYKCLRIINYSINAFFDETYKLFTGLLPDNLDRIHKALGYLHTTKPWVETRASMVFDPVYHTDLERDLFIDYWQGKVHSVWVNPAASAFRPDKVAVLSTRPPCRSLFSDIVVGFDGRLTSCCFDAGMKIDLGEYTGDLRADWKNPKLEALRALHNNGCRTENEYCKECTFA